MLRFGTWNLRNYHRGRAEETRDDAVAAVIAALDVDVLAVQEVCGYRGILQNLAEAAGMTAALTGCEFDRDDVAVDPGQHGFGLGLMWRPGRLHASCETLRRGGTDFWHGLLLLRFRLDDTDHELDLGSYHAPPYGPLRRNEEAGLVAARATRDRTIPAIPSRGRPRPARAAVIGGDWNAIGESENADPDPFADRPWHPDNVHHCRWEADGRGEPTRWWADRAASRTLHAGGLVDAWTHLHATGRGGHWTPTVGHHPGTGTPPRRIDGLRLTRPALPALRTHTVITPDRPGMPAGLDAISDHRPVVIELDPRDLPA